MAAMRILLLVLVLGSSQSMAVTYLDEGGEQAGIVDRHQLPALGVVREFTRWNQVIRLGYDPAGAHALFGDVEYFLGLLREAVDRWEAVSGVRFQILPAQSYPEDHASSMAFWDGIVRIGWSTALEPRHAGIAYVRPERFSEALGYIPTGDGAIYLNSSVASSMSGHAMLGLLAHELGHIIGLGHSDNPKSIMFANPYSMTSYPKEDDIRAVQTLYGMSERYFSPALPLKNWVYQLPPSAEEIKTRYLFKANQYMTDGGYRLQSNATEERIDGIGPHIDMNDRVNLIVAVGDFSNTQAIETVVQAVVTDPDGYLHNKFDVRLHCQTRYACANGVASIPVGQLRLQPGNWTVHLVEHPERVATPELLHSIVLYVYGHVESNPPPYGKVGVMPHANGTQAYLSAAVFDSNPDSDGVEVVWHLPGTLTDRNGDGIPDYSVVQNAVHGGATDFLLYNPGRPGKQVIFVEINDRVARYAGAGRGFQTLLRVELNFPLASQDSMRVISSSIVFNESNHLGMSRLMAEELQESPWPLMYSGVYSAPILGLPFNNIGVIDEADLTIRTCLRILSDSSLPFKMQPGLEMDFEIKSMEAGRIQVRRFREFNASRMLMPSTELPDCSGVFDPASGRYQDILQLGNTIFDVEFEMVNEQDLILELRAVKEL